MIFYFRYINLFVLALLLSACSSLQPIKINPNKPLAQFGFKDNKFGSNQYSGVIFEDPIHCLKPHVLNAFTNSLTIQAEKLTTVYIKSESYVVDPYIFSFMPKANYIYLFATQKVTEGDKISISASLYQRKQNTKDNWKKTSLTSRIPAASSIFVSCKSTNFQFKKAKRTMKITHLGNKRTVTVIFVP